MVVKFLVIPISVIIYIYIYIRQTVDEFRFRCNNYKNNYRKHQRVEACMQQHLYEHFCSSNHNCFIGDVLVTFIDKTYSSDPLKREDYWRSYCYYCYYCYYCKKVF